MIRCYVESLGCARNTVESELMMARLAAAGFEVLDGPDEADCVIINSCGFIHKAKVETARTFLSYKTDFPGKKIVVAGCFAVRDPGDVGQMIVEPDAIFAEADTSSIGEWLRAQYGLRGPAPAPAPFFEGARPLLSAPGSAYVRVSEGCVNRCSFCAIPSIRGPLKSRPLDRVLAECAALLRRGVKELCFVAQDLSSYGADLGGGPLLPALLERLRALKGDFWARLLYLHPDHFPLEILPVIRSDPRLLPYFDLPFQHAAPAVLRAMNRSGGAEAYLDLLRTIRAALPDAVIRSTFMTGFPGETGADFEALLGFQREAALDWMGCFLYSPEEGTAACGMDNHVPRDTAKARKKALLRAQTPVTRAALKRAIGTREPVLVEKLITRWDSAGEGGEYDYLYIGRLRRHAPEVDAFVSICAQRELPEGSFTEGDIAGINRFNLKVNC